MSSSSRGKEPSAIKIRTAEDAALALYQLIDKFHLDVGGIFSHVAEELNKEIKHTTVYESKGEHTPDEDEKLLGIYNKFAGIALNKSPLANTPDNILFVKYFLETALNAAITNLQSEDNNIRRLTREPAAVNETLQSLIKQPEQINDLYGDTPEIKVKIEILNTIKKLAATTKPPIETYNLLVNNLLGNMPPLTDTQYNSKLARETLAELRAKIADADSFINDILMKNEINYALEKNQVLRTALQNHLSASLHQPLFMFNDLQNNILNPLESGQYSLANTVENNQYAKDRLHEITTTISTMYPPNLATDMLAQFTSGSIPKSETATPEQQGTLEELTKFFREINHIQRRGEDKTTIYTRFVERIVRADPHIKLRDKIDLLTFLSKLIAKRQEDANDVIASAASSSTSSREKFHINAIREYLGENPNASMAQLGMYLIKKLYTTRYFSMDPDLSLASIQDIPTPTYPYSDNEETEPKSAAKASDSDDDYESDDEVKKKPTHAKQVFTAPAAYQKPMVNNDMEDEHRQVAPPSPPRSPGERIKFEDESEAHSAAYQEENISDTKRLFRRMVKAVIETNKHATPLEKLVTARKAERRKKEHEEHIKRAAQAEHKQREEVKLQKSIAAKDRFHGAIATIMQQNRNAKQVQLQPIPINPYRRMGLFDTSQLSDDFLTQRPRKSENSLLDDLADDESISPTPQPAVEPEQHASASSDRNFVSTPFSDIADEDVPTHPIITSSMPSPPSPLSPISDRGGAVEIRQTNALPIPDLDSDNDMAPSPLSPLSDSEETAAIQIANEESKPEAAVENSLSRRDSATPPSFEIASNVRAMRDHMYNFAMALIPAEISQRNRIQALIDLISTCCSRAKTQIMTKELQTLSHMFSKIEQYHQPIEPTDLDKIQAIVISQARSYGGWIYNNEINNKMIKLLKTDPFDMSTSPSEKLATDFMREIPYLYAIYADKESKNDSAGQKEAANNLLTEFEEFYKKISRSNDSNKIAKMSNNQKAEYENQLDRDVQQHIVNLLQSLDSKQTIKIRDTALQILENLETLHTTAFAGNHPIKDIFTKHKKEIAEINTKVRSAVSSENSIFTSLRKLIEQTGHHITIESDSNNGVKAKPSTSTEDRQLRILTSTAILLENVNKTIASYADPKMVEQVKKDLKIHIDIIQKNMREMLVLDLTTQIDQAKLPDMITKMHEDAAKLSTTIDTILKKYPIEQASASSSLQAPGKLSLIQNRNAASVKAIQSVPPKTPPRSPKH